MNQPNLDSAVNDCVFATILGFTLPFYLAGAAGDAGIAKLAVLDLIEAYGASTPGELDLVGRIVGFSAAAMDNLRLSMAPGLSDAKVLRYRSNAVALGRASQQAQTLLEALQARQEQPRKIPRPMVADAAAPPAQPVQAQSVPAQADAARAVQSHPVPAQADAARAVDAQSVPAQPDAARVVQSHPVPVEPMEAKPALQAKFAVSTRAHLSESLRGIVVPAGSGVSEFPALDIESMKREARIMMAAFSRDGAAPPAVPADARAIFDNGKPVADAT